ncbi:hypothetical protein PybrP1_007197 [[Pythium] brassicae (nom. inval.)]|nr:hypothetical protein PybrP1_007197 [[Pythium] brassicae (nom. inval.)]
MKFVLAIAAAAIASVAAYDEITLCDQSSELGLIGSILNDPTTIENLTTCQDSTTGSTDGIWLMLPPSGYPTQAQRDLMCTENACLSLIDAVKAVKPNDCVLVFGDVRMNVKKLAEEFEPLCLA